MFIFKCNEVRVIENISLNTFIYHTRYYCYLTDIYFSLFLFCFRFCLGKEYQCILFLFCLSKGKKNGHIRRQADFQPTDYLDVVTYTDLPIHYTNIY